MRHPTLAAIFIVVSLVFGVRSPRSGRDGQGLGPGEKSTDPRPLVPDPYLARGADLILLHGKIWTGEPYAKPGEKETPARFAQAVAVANGRILAVGTDDEIQAYTGPNTQAIDLHGRFAMPGFIDDHVHFSDGSFQLLQIDLKNVRSEAEFVRQIGEKAKTLAPGRWLLGGDWDEEAWPDAKLPTRWMIDAVTPNNPVYISRYDGHAGLANSLAMKLAGVTKDAKDPVGGRIVRDPKTHEPTGVFKDAAQGLIEHVIPNPSEAEYEEAIKTGLAEARRVGVTSVEDMNLGGDTPDGQFTGEIRLLSRAEREGWLTCRFTEYIPIRQWKTLADAALSHNMGSDFLKLGGVKGFADGSLGSRTAWMFEPYADDPHNFGIPLPMMSPPAKMEAAVRGADAAGIQIAVHAIGTRAVAEMLDIYQRVGGADSPAHRFRIEHAQHMRPQDFARFGKLGIVASMQPYHAIDDGRWAEKRINHEVAKYSYAWRSMLDAGAPLAFGTDWPVAPLNPLLGIYAAVTRATLDGKHPEGWFPEQKLTLDEALRAYTAGSAYAAFQEGDRGTIAPGKLGDVIVLSDDLFSIAPEKIRDAHVEMTIVGGKVVFQ
ncbi:MAG TPA: amidohydrolase [Terriglobia bacterium]|nr:amidohydrolase [Terriglobia bacterium]